MNKENLLRVADAIEKHEIEWLGFNMIDFVTSYKDVTDQSGHKCGTKACVAGWAAAVSKAVPTSDALVALEYSSTDCFDTAREFFEMTSDEASEMFAACPTDNSSFEDTTPIQAVRTLRYAAEHGVVDWNAANEGHD